MRCSLAPFAERRKLALVQLYRMFTFRNPLYIQQSIIPMKKSLLLLTSTILFLGTTLLAQDAPKPEPCDELNVLTGKLKQHFVEAIKPALQSEQNAVLERLSEADRDTLMALRERQAQLDEEFAAYEEKVATLANEGSAKAVFEGPTAAMANDIRKRQMALNAQLNALYETNKELIDGQMESVLAMRNDWEEQRESIRGDFMDVPCVAAYYNPATAPQSAVKVAEQKQQKQEKALIKNPNNAGKKITMDNMTVKKIDPAQLGNAKLRQGLEAADEPAPTQEVVRDEQDLAYRNQGEEIVRIRRTAAFLLWDARTVGYEAPKYFFAW